MSLNFLCFNDLWWPWLKYLLEVLDRLAKEGTVSSPQTFRNSALVSTSIDALFFADINKVETANRPARFRYYHGFFRLRCENIGVCDTLSENQGSNWKLVSFPYLKHPRVLILLIYLQYYQWELLDKLYEIYSLWS